MKMSRGRSVGQAATLEGHTLTFGPWTNPIYQGSLSLGGTDIYNTRCKNSNAS